MRKYKTGILITGAILAVLVVSYMLGGQDSRNAGVPGPVSESVSEPEAMPNALPARSEETAQPGGSGDNDAFTVLLSVRCDTLLGNMDLLKENKRELVPEDGVILPQTEALAYAGESVFQVLQRELKRAGIHLEFMSTPIYNSAYIEGIYNLYEFDAGELSGWMYSVNGWYPSYGCSRYPLAPDDVIDWQYSCELGRDLGEEGLDGFQKDE
ncbi:MAG: DUF4430 domain-containing protein [Clostridiales bacterium]|nr:DUF4430 domain-containing protein [Clostridiales bacterium]